jgi:hypothetical protein
MKRCSTSLAIRKIKTTMKAKSGGIYICNLSPGRLRQED